METRTTTVEIVFLTAAEGFVLTDGQIAVRAVACAPDRAALWREIPEAEWNPPNEEEAPEADPPALPEL